MPASSSFHLSSSPMIGCRTLSRNSVFRTMWFHALCGGFLPETGFDAPRLRRPCAWRCAALRLRPAQLCQDRVRDGHPDAIYPMIVNQLSAWDTATCTPERGWSSPKVGLLSASSPCSTPRQFFEQPLLLGD